MAVHVYTQTIHRTTEYNKRTTQITTNVEECGPYPVFASFTLAFALELRKKHGKTSVRVRKTSVRLRKPSVRVQYTCYQNTNTLQNPHMSVKENLSKVPGKVAPQYLDLRGTR